MDFVDHVIAEIIEAELVVGTIGNIGGISFLTGTWFEVTHTFVFVILVDVFWIVDKAGVSNNNSDRHAEEVVNWSVPAGVTLCEVVVYSYNMNTFSCQGIEICWKKSDEGFTFTSLHLGDVAFMECDTTDELNIEVAHLKDAAACFADKCKSVWKNLIKSTFF